MHFILITSQLNEKPICFSIFSADMQTCYIFFHFPRYRISKRKEEVDNCDHFCQQSGTVHSFGCTSKSTTNQYTSIMKYLWQVCAAKWNDTNALQIYCDWNLLHYFVSNFHVNHWLHFTTFNCRLFFARPFSAISISMKSSMMICID